MATSGSAFGPQGATASYHQGAHEHGHSPVPPASATAGSGGPTPRRPAGSARFAPLIVWGLLAGAIGYVLSSNPADRDSVRVDAADPLPDIVARLNDVQPDVLVGYASMIRALADEQLRITPRTVNSASEVLTAEPRAMAIRAWRVPPFDAAPLVRRRSEWLQARH